MKILQCKKNIILLLLSCALVPILFSVFEREGFSEETIEQESGCARQIDRPLVFYFSRSGKTRMVANALQTRLSCDIEEIKSKKKRTGFRGNMTCMLDQVFNRKDKQEPYVKELQSYNPILICSPNWIGKLSSPVRTFVKETNLQGKDAYLFVTYTAWLSDRRVKKMGDWLSSQGLNVKGAYKIKSWNKTQEEINLEVNKIMELISVEPSALEMLHSR